MHGRPPPRRGGLSPPPARRGFTCEPWTDPPGQRWEHIVHDVDELMMVVDGAVEFEIAGARHRPQPARELLIPAGANHSVRNVGTTGAHWLYGHRRKRDSRH